MPTKPGPLHRGHLHSQPLPREIFANLLRVMRETKQRIEPARTHRIAGSSDRVIIREPALEDCEPFLRMVDRSRGFHRPWVCPPDTPAAFVEYLERHGAPDHKAFLVCHRSERAILGVFNLSQIVRRFFQNAYLGFYVDSQHAGQGYMTEGLQLVFRQAFAIMKLHRLEANIQPENARSICLVKRSGFEREGYSRRYLKTHNRWRDHERWAILAENWRSIRHTVTN
jgi:[ribosomal protein S5]-alanine N-acetyltransferase